MQAGLYPRVTQSLNLQGGSTKSIDMCSVGIQICRSDAGVYASGPKDRDQGNARVLACSRDDVGWAASRTRSRCSRNQRTNRPSAPKSNSTLFGPTTDYSCTDSIESATCANQDPRNAPPTEGAAHINSDRSS
jgi:hypothetical protein